MADDKDTPEDVTNSLSGLVGTIASGSIRTAQLSKADTQYVNLRNYLVSNDRTLLSRMYVEHGIVQTLIDQPVDDAFRGGFEIKTAQLDPEEIERLETYLERNRIIYTITDALKWARLFGGAGIIINTESKYDEPLNIEDIGEGKKVEFIAADMWELLGDAPAYGASAQYVEPEFYNYYDKRIHHSRVYRINGKHAPSFIRQQLRGWGMSEIEKLIRSINQYMKNQDLIFELLDEAKVDVYKINGFNSSLLSSNGTDATTKRVQLANMMKNFQNAVVMDKDDEYEQKSMNFSGLAEMLKQIREGVAADLKMPVTKLFGISSAGFNSGEDDIENYNSMIESEIRSRVKFIVVDMLSICCRRLFGIAPDDLSITFPPLRMMSTEQEEIAKTNQYNRIVSSFQNGLIDGMQAQEAINAAELLPIAIDADGELEAPLRDDAATDYTVGDASVEA